MLRRPVPDDAVRRARLRGGALRAQPVERGGDRVAGRPRRRARSASTASPTGATDRRRGRGARSVRPAAGCGCGACTCPTAAPSADPHYHVQAGMACRTAQHGAAAGCADDPQAQIALVGDWNIAPTDEDVWDVDGLRDSTHVTEPERAAFAAIVDARSPMWCGRSRPGPGSTPTGTTPSCGSRSARACASTSSSAHRHWRSG